MSATDPVVTFVLILVVGIVAGILFDRLAGPSWLARQSPDRPAKRQRASVFAEAIVKATLLVIRSSRPGRRPWP
jgi:hypothetical protein